MIKFHDPSGAPHFGQATITRTTSVNGGLSLTGEVFAGDDVLNGLDYGWWLNFDNEKYVITYKKLSDDTNTVVFDAVQQFFWDFAKVALHAQYTGSHEYTFYLGQLFDKSGYTYKNDVTVPAFEKENWGYKNKLDLFNDIIDQAGVEFEVHNETVHIAKQIGNDLTSFARKGINLSDLTEEMKISDFATYAKGYGAFKDAEDQSKGRLEVEYRSELAKQFGDLEMDPIVDERYTIADNLIAALKKQVDATYTVSMTMNIYDLENAGYPNYEAPKVGDWILAIDEALNFKRKIRIIQLEEQFDVTGKRIGYTATCGDLSIVDQYTHLQSSLDSKVQRIQESVDNALSSANGKSTNYYGEKEPTSANEGDLWFDQSDSDPDKWSIKQWVNGRWEQITLNPGEVDAKVDVAKKEAETAVENAKSASDKADQLAAKYDDTNALANQALDRAVGAQSDASIAVATANSTASGFGKVDQKADSALTAALNAQTNASTAVTQASSAAADSKDAKQIAGAVSQSYKTLTDGSTMTIAELENGLATKLTKTDLDGYATQSWTQNQIKVTADGINATLSSVKTTVDGQTTSINDLKANSSSFKSQFTTVNNTLGKQTTDISTLQATSKDLTTGFNTLTTDNATNKNDISQLRQTATELSSTMMTVQTQVQDSAVGTNLLLDSQTQTRKPSWYTQNNNWTEDRGTYLGSNIEYIRGPWGNARYSYKDLLDRDVINTTDDFTYSIYFRVVGEDPAGMSYAYIDFLSTATTKNGFVPLQLTSLKEGQWVRIVVSFKFKDFEYDPTKDYNYSIRIEMSATPKVDDARYEFAAPKLEKGSVATDFSVNPEDTATVTAFSKLSQTVDGMQLDISKKIEQKDLNGYATQTWTQNQIKLTADGINSTLSSVKTTVDGQTTSINDLKADSSGFKAQFTTVNNTIGKHTTDIGTLQASNKSLSASFDSLNTDNNTNKHNISQLQATSSSFSSTLATVQQQVTDSSVGINLLRNTKDYSGWSAWAGEGKVDPTIVRDYAFTNLIQITGLTNTGIFSASMTGGGPVYLVTGQSYTFSVYAKAYTKSGSGLGINLGLYGDYTTQTQDGHGLFITSFTNGDWTRYSVTFVAKGSGPFDGWRVLASSTDSLEDLISIYLWGLKLEKGTVATNYSNNPADNATVTAVSSISQTIDSIQTTVRGKVDNDVYQSKLTQLSGQITTVVGQVNSLGQKNLIANSQFQYDWQNSWSISSHDWANWYTSNFTWAWLDGYQGICANIPQSQSESWPHIQSSDVAVPDPGVTAYSASVYVNIDWVETYCVLDMSFYNAAGVRTFHDTTASNKGLNFLKLENIVSPKDAVRVHIELHVHDHGHAAFIEPMFVQDSSVGKYIPDNASWTEVQQTYNSINLKVSKDGVINAVNISPEGIQIYGNKLHITAATYIDNAVIKDAMIANLNANKLTAGSINAANINVYNINGANIVANSITANQLQAGSLLIALNSTMQTMRIGTDGLYTTDNKGDGVGHIHTNSVVGHPDVYGLNFDLDATGDYMGWGAKNRGDPNGTYAIKLGWYRSDTANTIGNIKGFVFSDQVTLNGGIQVSGAYQNLGFGTSTFNNNTHYPYFGSTGMKAGLAYGSTDTYLISDGKYADMTKVIFALQGIGDAYIPVKLSDGKITSYVKANFQH
ncbi:phage tail protein [Lactiplantibacillus plantarum]|uniref:phage tail protein n=1 Tax=Lactiplantibacillus plantarum TaxID=1590 RepID=UPI0007BB8335|nr:phage tail protein [Lactiplantibacillus plantarum]KZU56759.1 Phage endopeptidase [Lactiplantibacillus plantarum]